MSETSRRPDPRWNGFQPCINYCEEAQHRAWQFGETNASCYCSLSAERLLCLSCMSTQDYVLSMRSDLKYNGSELCAWLQRAIWFISLIALATHRKRPMESVWRFLMIAGLRNVKPKESISSKLTSWVVFSWFNPLLGCSVGRAPCCSRRGSPDDVRDSRPQGLDRSQRPHNDKHSDGPMTSQYLNYNPKSLKGSTVEGKRHRRQIKLKQVDILLTTFRLDLRGSSTKNSSTKNNYSPPCRYKPVWLTFFCTEKSK